MTGIIISKIKYLSFAKFLAMYGFLFTLITLVIDAIVKLLGGTSAYVAAGTWGTWILYAIATLILAPIILFIAAFIIGAIINIALRVANGLELETK